MSRYWRPTHDSPLGRQRPPTRPRRPGREFSISAWLCARTRSPSRSCERGRKLYPLRAPAQRAAQGRPTGQGRCRHVLHRAPRACEDRLLSGSHAGGQEEDRAGGAARSIASHARCRAHVRHRWPLRVTTIVEGFPGRVDIRSR